jgi:protein-S-isoprenylcysteine O-methyltransferase Ste14
MQILQYLIICACATLVLWAGFSLERVIYGRQIKSSIRVRRIDRILYSYIDHPYLTILLCTTGTCCLLALLNYISI